MEQARIIIPKQILRNHFGGITNQWFIHHDMQLTSEDSLDEEILSEQFLIMELCEDVSFVVIALAYLLDTPMIQVNEYNGSESNWEERNVREAMSQTLSYLRKKKKMDLSSLADRVVLEELDEFQWCTTTKPQILQMLKAEGIEP
jgi:hypothetical protein